jgi:hypothetical protein
MRAVAKNPNRTRRFSRQQSQVRPRHEFGTGLELQAFALDVNVLNLASLRIGLLRMPKDNRSVDHNVTEDCLFDDVCS